MKSASKPMTGLHVPGMTLRDWFAGQTLVGLLAGPCRNIERFGLETLTSKDLAVWANRVADEMVESRRREGI